MKGYLGEGAGRRRGRYQDEDPDRVVDEDQQAGEKQAGPHHLVREGHGVEMYCSSDWGREGQARNYCIEIPVLALAMANVVYLAEGVYVGGE